MLLKNGGQQWTTTLPKYFKYRVKNKLPPNQFRVFAESPRKAQCPVRKVQSTIGDYVRWSAITKVL